MTRSLGSCQAASPLLPYKEIIYKFNLLSGSLLVATKAVPRDDTSCDYNDAWTSMSKAAVHCTSTQSLHCKTRNEVFKSFFLLVLISNNVSNLGTFTVTRLCFDFTCLIK